MFSGSDQFYRTPIKGELYGHWASEILVMCLYAQRTFRLLYWYELYHNLFLWSSKITHASGMLCAMCPNSKRVCLVADSGKPFLIQSNNRIAGNKMEYMSLLVVVGLLIPVGVIVRLRWLSNRLNYCLLLLLSADKFLVGCVLLWYILDSEL